ncbi:CBS domain-containing protein, partial [Bowmanella yangjiangensis]
MSLLAQTLSIRERQSILDAIECIEAGALQISFVVADDMRLLGVVTNGDVRRHLLQGGRTDEQVTACMNEEFRSVQIGVPREDLLKAFDLGHNALPGLDEHGRLVEVYTRQMAASAEVPVLARARA